MPAPPLLRRLHAASTLGLPHRIWFALMAFTVLSFLDLLLTWHLLKNPAGGMYEANPLAARILAAYGWLGLGVFKLLCVVVVAGIVIALARRRRRAAYGVARAGCWIVAGVVGYSACLLSDAGADPDAARLRAAHQRHEELNARLENQAAFGEQTAELARELIDEKETLAGATRRLRDHLAETGHDVLHHYRINFPGHSDQTYLAASLIRQTLAELGDDPPAAQKIRDRLVREYENEYQKSPPAFAVTLVYPPPADSSEEAGTPPAQDDG